MREADIRQQYAREALKYGHQKLSPEERPRRVVVLANVLANNGRVFEKFKINALPLLNLAGIEVSVIKVGINSYVTKKNIPKKCVIFKLYFRLNKKLCMKD